MPAVLTRPRLPRSGAITFAALWTASAACSSGIDSTPTNYTTAPSTAPVVYIAGTWNGTIESANFAPRTIKMIVVQSGNCVDGVWDSSPPEWTGAISGFATVDSYTGQISLERQASDGSKCTAVGNVAGPVTDATLRWTGDTMKAVGPCSGDLPTSIVITLRRQ
jgi:hypothetical protein